MYQINTILRGMAIALFMLIHIAVGYAQTISPVLDSILNKRLRDQRNSLGVKGLSAAVTFPDGSVWSGGAGVSSLAPLDSITKDHAFNIGSVTKTITSACILQMADDSLLQLDDKISEWLPPFNFIDSNITIRQLLRHQSGIYDIITSPGFQPAMLNDIDSMWTKHNAIKTFIQTPDFAPGTSWAYSNTNYLLLGMIIEAVSGQLYHQEIRERFLDPLNLATFAHPPFETLPPSVSNVWLDLNGDGTTDDAGGFIYEWNSFNYVAGPSGAYFSTSADLARWITTLVGTEDVLSPGMLQQAQVTASGATLPAGTKYGLGLMERKFMNITAFGHGGDLGYCANAWYFPSKDIGIAVLNNDASKNSWQVAPVVQALLQAYMNYQLATPAVAPAEEVYEMRVSPNPFTDMIYLTATLPEQTTSVKCEIVNTLGQTVLVFPSIKTNENTVNMPLQMTGYLPGGTYFLRVFADGQMIGTHKVLKSE